MNPLPGFRDFYPETLAVRRYIFDKWRDVARRYGFREYDGPPLEPLELYTQKSGEEIVGQLFNFVDKGDRAVALRPEMTPTLARMVGAHHRDFNKPIKWFAIPQLFRYEKQQRGRLREHFQFNADIIGAADVGADAELIALAIDTLRSFGLTKDDFVVRVSSREAWRNNLAARGIESPEQQIAVYQAVDKLEREPREKTREKLTKALLTDGQIDSILEFAELREGREVRIEHILPEFQALHYLPDELRAFCRVDLSIVRGLAYYTGVVWEIHDRKGELRAIAGGGRYDNLLKQVSGVDLPALGFGMGDVVLTELLKARGLLPKTDEPFDCYVVIVDEPSRPQALSLVHTLREERLKVHYTFSPTRVAKQFEVAQKIHAKFAVVVGPDELKTGQIKLKDMATGKEQLFPADGIEMRGYILEKTNS